MRLHHGTFQICVVVGGGGVGVVVVVAPTTYVSENVTNTSSCRLLIMMATIGSDQECKYQ
jgi:hypothetical protein